METPIYRAAYRWTSEEAETAMRRHRDSQLSRPYVLLVSVFSALIGALVLWMLFTAARPGGPEKPWVTLAFPAFAFYWIFLRNPMLSLQSRWSFKKRPDADQLVEWEILPQELKVYQRGLSYSAVAWKSFVKVLEFEDGLLLYTQPRLFVWLPFRAFEMPEAPERVREIVQASGVTYKKISI